MQQGISGLSRRGALLESKFSHLISFFSIPHSIPTMFALGRFLPGHVWWLFQEYLIMTFRNSLVFAWFHCCLLSISWLMHFFWCRFSESVPPFSIMFAFFLFWSPVPTTACDAALCSKCGSLPDDFVQEHLHCSILKAMYLVWKL